LPSLAATELERRLLPTFPRVETIGDRVAALLPPGTGRPGS